MKPSSIEYSYRKAMMRNRIIHGFSRGYPKARPVSNHRGSAGIMVDISGVTKIKINITLWYHENSK